MVGPIIGPTLGGWLTESFNWRWVFFINVPVGILSLLLSARIVRDPPWLVEARRRVWPIDYPGFALIALGLGSLEYVLDKGQESDWFASSSITLFSALAAASLVAFVAWEWRQEHPVVDVRMFRARSFATSALMMLVLGIALYGSTVLLPQYEQVWMGYSAQQAGEALSPGGLTVILLLPLVGRLVSKVDARWLIAFGFAVISASLFHMAHSLYPGIDFRSAVLLRVYQSVGLAFLFVPINTVAYQGVPPEKNNAVSGTINLARNVDAHVSPLGTGATFLGIVNKPGVFQGMASHYSGAGFSGMTFKFHGLSDGDFAQWVQKAKSAGKPLDSGTYLQLAKPSERDPVQHFASVEEGLYDKVLNRCVEDGKMCMHHMMAIDALGGDAYLKAAGLNLPQDVCTVDNAAQVLAALETRNQPRATTQQSSHASAPSRGRA